MPRVAVTAALANQLRPYQAEGVRFLYRRWREDVGAILGDDMVHVRIDLVTCFLLAGPWQNDSGGGFAFSIDSRLWWPVLGHVSTQLH